ncbi:MAG: hypothetical protein ACYC6O_01860 [Thermoleophilia bacterium]
MQTGVVEVLIPIASTAALLRHNEPGMRVIVVPMELFGVTAALQRGTDQKNSVLKGAPGLYLWG